MATLLLVGGLAAIFAALTVAFATFGEASGQRHQQARTLALVRSMSVDPTAAAAAHAPFAQRVVVPALARLGALGRALTPAGHIARLRHRLDLAGSPAGWDADRVLALQTLGLGIGLVGCAVAGSVFGGSRLAVAGAIGGAVAGWLAPDVAVRSRAAKRQEQIGRQLPDALDLLTICVEAGLGFDAALAQVARNTEGPLADEVFRVLQEMQLGSARAAALRALAERSEVPELRGFITSVVQADGFGIPVANVLRVQASEMRLQRTQKAEELAQKVPVKILFPLIFCILPSLFVVVLGPAAISIMRNFNF